MQSTRHPSLRNVVFTALITASAGCAAQIPAPSAAQPAARPVPSDVSPPPPAPRAPGAAPGPFADAASTATTQGTVARFLTNPDGDVDGFMTDDGTLVRFPPHMSTQLTSAVRRGDSVQVTGRRDEGGSFAAQRIIDTRSGQQVIDEPPMRGMPPLPRAARGEGLSRLSAEGQVTHVTSAPRGEPDGVILSDGTVIALTPRVAQRFPALVHAGATVSAQGYGTRNQYGTALQATAFGTPGNLTPLYDRASPMP
ncbi:hypothetical protein P9239_23155 [Caballeronia sp. LZ062]|uniref:hypothetical protein n=1 Tax=unclassified Caballeronia TaxID=2646786 RepID=UPI00285FDBFE|nr:MULTISPECIES: hypothetical protein [unclassified Caballeronia]MDR5856586.1 hypothetical protein [Caballeronia sp. LZ050]MDR5873256.1 hypothetical protein [Caballeronia sp. LZ062]